MFSEQAWILTYVPGNGASGYIKGISSQIPYTLGMSVSTGTDSIATNLITYVLHPSSDVTFFKMGGLRPPSMIELYVEPSHSFC